MAGKGVEITNRDREAIRLYRISANLSRKTVAEAAGKSIRWLGRIERGGPAILTNADLWRLAKVLDISPEDLLSGR
jgi:transcriptional regulator with XRE-family HTH domain